MARKFKEGRELIKVELNKDNPNDIENMKQSKKNGFIFLRKEILGRVPLYELDFLNKIKLVIDYLNESTGRSARRIEAKRAKEVDRLSALEVVGYNFINEKVTPKITRRTKKVGFQLDTKYNEIVTQLILKNASNNHTMEILEINPNYMKYCRDIPVIATIEKDQTDEI